MRKTKWRRIVLWLVVVFLLVVVPSTKNLSKRVSQIDSPNRRFSVFVNASGGWGNLIDGQSFRVEVLDNRSGEHLVVADQPQREGWNFFAPAGLKWGDRDNKFACLWNVESNGTLTQIFTIQSNPLNVTSTAIG